MSGKIIRTGSGADHRQSRTDWARVKALTDAEIDAAIACDPDAYALETETHGRTGSAYHYEVFEETAGKYRWRLVGANGQAMALSHESYASKAAARKAIGAMRDALLGGKSMAA